MIRTTRAAQQAAAQKAQEAQEAEDELRAQNLAERRRTLERARYAAQLLVGHGIAPTVRLRKALPQTYSRGLFGRRWNPVEYVTITDGWLVDEWLVDSGSFRDGVSVYYRVGLVLGSDGALVRYGTGWGQVVLIDPNFKGDLLVDGATPLRDDFSTDEGIASAYFEGRTGVFGDKHAHMIVRDPMPMQPFEQALQQQLAQLIARAIPG